MHDRERAVIEAAKDWVAAPSKHSLAKRKALRAAVADLTCHAHGRSCPFEPEHCKADLYVRQGEDAAADIATWPKWMQRNLNPTRVPVLITPEGAES